SRPAPAKSWLRKLARGVTNLYREVLYLFLQRIVFRGQMEVFGTVCTPAGCAVAYRRTYLETLFDKVEPQLGDDLTNSEDIFIGLAMLDEGYRNIQVIDVLAPPFEPEVPRRPTQVTWRCAIFCNGRSDVIRGAERGARVARAPLRRGGSGRASCLDTRQRHRSRI